MMLTSHFSEAELACKCGCKRFDMDRDFLTKLESLRNVYNQTMVITSGFRCNNWNQKCKGSPNSQHTVGKAVDILVTDAGKRYKLVEMALTLGFKGIGIDGCFVHVDTRSLDPALWIYPVKNE